MTPTLYLTLWTSPFGPLLLGATDEALCICAWCTDPVSPPLPCGHKAVVQTLRHLPHPTPVVICAEDNPAALPTVTAEAIAQLTDYFRGLRTHFSVPLRPLGTPFQQRVWHSTASIPFGGTLSYGALTRRLGLHPAAARAVGQALGANPVSLFLPCHRVVGSNGALTGYAGTVAVKQRLLALEAPTLPLVND